MRTREWIAGIASILLFVFYIATEWEGPPRIQRGQNFDERMAAVHSVAILPMECPSPLIDCALAERELVDFLRTEQRLRVLESAQVSQLLVKQGLRTADAMGKDFEKLDVDALMVPRVLEYHRDRRYRGRLPGIRLLAGLELIVPGEPPLVKGTNRRVVLTRGSPAHLLWAEPWCACPKQCSKTQSVLPPAERTLNTLFSRRSAETPYSVAIPCAQKEVIL